MREIINRFYYCICLTNDKMHYASNKINPILLLFKLPFFKRRFKNKFNIDDPLKVYNETWTDKETGSGLMFSSAFLVFTLFISIASIINLLIGVLNFNLILHNYYFYFAILVSYITCYFLVFKNDNYLKYFKQYKTWTKSEKRKNVWFSFGFIAIIIVLFFLSVILF